VIDDDQAVREVLSFQLGSAGIDVRTYDSAVGFLKVAPMVQAGCIRQAAADEMTHRRGGDGGTRLPEHLAQTAHVVFCASGRVLNVIDKWLSKKCRPLFKKHESNKSLSLIILQTIDERNRTRPNSPGSSSHRPLG
jgi:FixJ family two-component response regulator